MGVIVKEYGDDLEEDIDQLLGKYQLSLEKLEGGKKRLLNFDFLWHTTGEREFLSGFQDLLLHPVTTEFYYTVFVIS